MATMSREQAEQFRQEQIDGVTTVLVMRREILPESTQELYGIADRLADTHEPRRVVLNLVNVQSMMSVSIAILINFQKRVRDAGGTLKLCRIHPDVARAFQLTHVDQLFDIHERQRDAIDAYHGRLRPKEGGLGSLIARLFGK
jgi:anti-anti-sigma factor